MGVPAAAQALNTLGKDSPPGPTVRHAEGASCRARASCRSPGRLPVLPPQGCTQPDGGAAETEARQALGRPGLPSPVLPEGA